MAKLSAHMKRKARKLERMDKTVVTSGRYWSDSDTQWQNVGFASIGDMAEWQSIMQIKLEGVRNVPTTG